MQPQCQVLEVQQIFQLSYKMKNLWKTCKFSISEQSDTDNSSDSDIHNHSDDVLVSDMAMTVIVVMRLLMFLLPISCRKKQTIKMDTFTEVAVVTESK
jgi:hypothetical protein